MAESLSPESSPEPNPPRIGAVAGIVASLIVMLVALLAVFWLVGGGGGVGAQNAADATAEVKPDRVQAVYMTNDRLFFGRLEAMDGNWFELRDAFYLRRSASEAKEDAGSTEIVPISEEVGGDGDLLLNGDEVVLIQNLAATSDIARTIEDATD